MKMKLKKAIGLKGASVKKAEGDWFPVFAFEFAVNDGDPSARDYLRRKCGGNDQYLVNDVVFVSYEDDIDVEDDTEIVCVTFGIKESAAATFYRQARVIRPLFTVQDANHESLYDVWEDMCDHLCDYPDESPDNHTAMVFGGHLAIAFSDGRLAISDQWEEGLW